MNSLGKIANRAGCQVFAPVGFRAASAVMALTGTAHLIGPTFVTEAQQGMQHEAGVTSHDV